MLVFSGKSRVLMYACFSKWVEHLDIKEGLLSKTIIKTISATLPSYRHPSSPIFDNLYLRCRLKVLPCYHRGGHITIMAVEMQLIVADGEESIKVQSNLVPLKRSFHKHIGCHGNKLYGRAEPCGVTSFRKDSMHMFKLS